jgi:hypothetical protein
MQPPDSFLTIAASTRRDFLKKSLLGTLALGSAGFLAQCKRRVTMTPRPEGALVFDAPQFKTLTGFCQGVLPASETQAARAVPYRIDAEVSHWSPKDQAQVKSLLVLIENGPRYFFFNWRPFVRLAPSERQEYLRGWESSRFGFRRQAFQALRMLAQFYFYSQDETWKAISYDGPWVKASSHRVTE